MTREGICKGDCAPELLDALQRQRERMNPMIPDAGEVVISKEVADNLIERLSRIKPNCVIDGSTLLRVLGKKGEA